jgi:hypothetical protein
VSCAKTPLDIMMQCTALTQWHPNQCPLGLIRSFTNGLWNFAGLACAITDTAFAITYNNKRCEGETTTTLNNFGYTIDVYQLVYEFITIVITITLVATTTAASATAFSTTLGRIVIRHLSPS